MTRFPLYRRLGGPHGRSGLVRKFSLHRDSIPGPTALFQPTVRTSVCLISLRTLIGTGSWLSLSVPSQFATMFASPTVTPHCRKHVPSWRLMFLNLSGNVPLSIIVFTTARLLSLLRATCTESTVSHSRYCRSLSLLPPSKWSSLYRHLHSDTTSPTHNPAT